MGKGDRKKRQAPPGCELPPVRKSSSIRAVPDARTYKGKFEDDPRNVVLNARARHAGLATSQTGRKIAEAPYMGSELGVVLFEIYGPDGATRLWNVWQGLCQAEDRYIYFHFGLRRTPRTAFLQQVRARVETEDYRHDARSDEEKARDAANAWARWRGYLGHLPKGQQSLLLRTYEGLSPKLRREQAGTTTATGHAVAMALKALADVLDMKRL